MNSEKHLNQNIANIYQIKDTDLKKKHEHYVSISTRITNIIIDSHIKIFSYLKCFWSLIYAFEKYILNTPSLSGYF